MEQITSAYREWLKEHKYKSKRPKTPQIYGNKFIQAKDDKLYLNPDINTIENTKIISIIGDARKGKSTFLNCIINYLTKSNIEYFKVQSSTDHCTKGMDYINITIDKQKYLFIDCQGLNYEDSKLDSKYLLLIYSISNIIIYNDLNIINNNFLTTLQPMSLFLQSFQQKTNKSILYIRIADYSLDDESSKLKDKLLLLQKDQFDNVKISIKKLFDEIHICDTEHLDRNEIKLLKNKNFNQILETPENKFKNVIETILYKLDSTENKTLDLQKLITFINENKKIDYNKLDIYTLNTDINIREFIENNISQNKIIQKFNKKDISSCNGTLESRKYLDHILDNLQSIKQEFMVRFERAPEKLTMKMDKEYDPIYDKILQFIEYNKHKAEIIITPIFEQYTQHIIKQVCQIDLLQSYYFDDKTKLNIDIYDYDVVKKYYISKNHLIQNVKSKIQTCYKYNQLKLLSIEEQFKNINYNVPESIKIMSLDNCSKGDYKSYLMTLLPYKHIQGHIYDFKHINDKLQIYKVTQIQNIIKKFKSKYCMKFLKESMIHYDLYLQQIISLLNGNTYENIPDIYNKDLYFVKFTKDFTDPTKLHNVYIEYNYLMYCLKQINISNKVFKKFFTFYRETSKDNILELTNDKIYNNVVVSKIMADLQIAICDGTIL